jgi:DNA-binding transcriptional LysR family regulator
MDLDPTLLRAFMAVKEAGGFTRAAERLHVTQSAVSHQIRRLEDQIGRPLLYRTTRQLTLTEDGLDFAYHAEQVLTSLDALARRFESPAVSGGVRFGVPESYMGERLPPLLSKFSRRFPGVRLDVTVSSYLDLRRMVGAGELDLAVVLSDLGNTSDETVLRETQFVWSAAETFEIRRDSSLPLVFAPSPCVDRKVATAALDLAAIEWHIAFTSPSQEGIRAAVLAGLGVTLQMRDDSRAGMKVIDGKSGLPPLPKANFSLVWSVGNKTAATREFGQLLLDLAKDTPTLPGQHKGKRAATRT